jgi:formylglycine-generating enzyme required for sulfatase activity
MFLVLLLLAGCGEEVTKEEKPEDIRLKERITWQKDGSEMVLIPAGLFEMGDHFGEWEANERPVHKVTLDGFYMDTDEVTVGQFKVFLADSGYNWGGSWNNVGKYSPGDEYPMVSVDWNDATAYAKWAGKRLPTEAEWEYAARGGLIGKRYPWGNEIDKTKAHYDSWNGGNGTTKAVGSFEANGYGLNDMAGNVWEWCADWYDKDYYQNSPAKNPLGPGTGKYRVLRGGDWFNNTSNLRVALRNGNGPNYGYGTYGFRCVSGSN